MSRTRTYSGTFRPLDAGFRRDRLLVPVPELWRRRLEVVVAPAGSGKTTLLGQLAERAGVPVAWYSAEDLYSGAGDLLSQLRDAFQVALGQGRDLAEWTSVQQAVEDLESDAGSRSLLVVDDLHRLDGTEAERVLMDFVDHAPPEMAVVVASRVTPAWNLSRRRVAGRIALLVWLEPGAARLSDWSGQLRAGLTGDPMAVHRAGVSSTDPGMLLAAGLTALAAGCPRHAVEPLSKVVDHSASSAALVASARLGLAGAALLAGELPADIDAAAEQLEVLGLGGLTRVASVLRPFAAGGDVRAEAAAVEAACRRVGDEWGVAAASFLLGWGLMARHDPAGAVAAFCATATIQAAAGMSDMHNCNVPPIRRPSTGSAWSLMGARRCSSTACPPAGSGTPSPRRSGRPTRS